jgi:hypothetical protein
MKLRRSLYAPPVVVGGQQCAKAPPDGGVSPSTAWSRRWPARGRVVACGPVPAADHPTQRLPGGASGRCSRRRASPWSGRPSRPPHRPLPVLVHRWCPPGPDPRPVRCPTVRCPTVGVSNRRVSGHLAPSSRTDLSGRLVPPVRRSAVWCPPVSPVASVPSRVSPPWPLGVRRSGRGLRGWSGSGSGWPSGSVDGCGGLDAGDPAEVMGRPGGGERRSRTWPGRARAEAAALDR